MTVPERVYYPLRAVVVVLADEHGLRFVDTGSWVAPPESAKEAVTRVQQCINECVPLAMYTRRVYSLDSEEEAFVRILNPAHVVEVYTETQAWESPT